jgi:hypothetical protein
MRELGIAVGGYWRHPTACGACAGSRFTAQGDLSPRESLAQPFLGDEPASTPALKVSLPEGFQSCKRCSRAFRPTHGDQRLCGRCRMGRPRGVAAGVGAHVRGASLCCLLVCVRRGDGESAVLLAALSVARSFTRRAEVCGPGSSRCSETVGADRGLGEGPLCARCRLPARGVGRRRACGRADHSHRAVASRPRGR